MNVHTKPTLIGDPVVDEARRRFDRASEWESVFRQRFLNDIKFENGDSDNGFQWPNEIRNARDTTARPCLTMNLIQRHNKMISNDLRKNKSSVKFIGMGNGATQESANVVQDLFRHMEYISQAQNAYTLARSFQIGGGRGWWRLVTDWANDDTVDEQEIKVLPVLDPLSIYMDPDIQQKSGLDAKWAFVFDDMPEDEFEEAYPDLMDLVGNQPLGMGTVSGDWLMKGRIRVCEYFRKVPKKGQNISFLHDDRTRITIPEYNLSKIIKDKDQRNEILDHPSTRIRNVIRWEVEWKLIAGEHIIDETTWRGKYIPLIRCIGEENVIEGVYDCKGHTRWSKDAQRMYNYNAALSVNTKIPTPTGWTSMGRLQAGDWIFGQDGKPVQVAEALPIRENEICYKITFDTGYSVVTDAGHIWAVEERGKRVSAGYKWENKTVSTEQLSAGMHFIHIAKDLELDELELPIDPYVLGVWLGDGHSRDARVSGHIDDIEEQKQLIADQGFTVGETHGENGNGAVFNIFGLREKLREFGLKNDKHVPAAYLRASRSQRLALLQGLMDTDGHYAKAVNQCIFINTNHDIVRAILELCASLNLKTTVDRNPAMLHENGVYISQISFRVQFTPDKDVPVFRLSRKASAQVNSSVNSEWRRTKRIGIKSIEEIASVPVRCITLDTPDHLFLCSEGMIPTHNSGQVEFVGGQTKTPWLAAAKAIEEHEAQWNSSNVQTASVLIWNHVDPGNPDQSVPPPIKIDPPQASPGYEAGMSTANNQIMMTSGQFQNELGMMGNERTGAAIEGRKQQSDTANFHFQDNYEDALRTTGIMFIDLFPKIFDTQRVERIQAEDGTDYDLEIDPGARQGYLEQVRHNKEVIRRIFNPQLGRYGIAASVGPSFESKMGETADALTNIVAQAPALIPIIGDLLVASLPFDKAQEAAIRLKRMIPPIALGEGPSQGEQQLQAQLQSLQAAFQKLLDEKAKDQLKLVGKEQLREIESYDAETKRISAMAKLLPEDMDGLKRLISQLVEDSLSTSITNVLSQHAPKVDTNGVEVEPAPIAGAQKAPDGEWYLTDPTRKGKYLHVAPLAQLHKRPGVIENA